MEVVDLNANNQKSYFCCLEEWSEDMKEAGNHKEIWFNEMKDKGLKVKLIHNENGVLAGMIQYMPIEYSFAGGQDLYFVNCIWVHGHKQGRGNLQNKGLGKALLKAAEEDALSSGSKGVVVWGLILPFFMKAAWFKKHGYKAVDRIGMQSLLWKPFSGDAVAPRWIRQRKKPEMVPGKVVVSAFVNGWCPAQNITYERAKRSAGEFGDKVLFKEYHTIDRNVFLEWGISDGLFVDKKQIWTGPPPSYEKIKGIIEKQVRKKRL
ncbi:MAG: GNAT family N-acetyltransferase [Eubacteriales bacterium]